MSTITGKKTALLIELVKRHPELYDIKHYRYKYTVMRNRLWNEIASHIEDTNGCEASTKWKTNKTWLWADQLSFLEPHLEHILALYQPKTNSKRDQESKEESDIESVKSQSDLKESCDKRKKIRIDMKKSLDKLNQVPDYDDIDLLFLSYAQWAKKLPPKSQVEIKFKVAQLVMETERTYLQETGQWTYEQRSCTSQEEQNTDQWFDQQNLDNTRSDSDTPELKVDVDESLFTDTCFLK